MSKSNSKKEKDTKRKQASKANYGANENLRACRHCQSDKSTVSRTDNRGGIIFRYRICDDCGARRTTRELVVKPAEKQV